MDHRATNPQFDIVEWYPQFLSCHRYFLDVAQHTQPVKALAAFINIQLPCQKHPNPTMSANAPSPHMPDMGGLMRPQGLFGNNPPAGHGPAISLTPYLRRLVATGHDSPGVLHGFFGDDWVGGVGSLHEIERRNYLFAAKSANWLKVKDAYDMSPQETIPFLRPLREATEKELESADSTWGEWMMMQDWMLGPREFQRDFEPSSRGMNHGQSPRVKREPGLRD
ncbi:hypothetical protein GLAREA_12798 [Glarea lozoyensis ATCC 20868]|uniref:Uncharacterized protein n=1 Tax=Glarea lozoyensis (strain ATCC 20868 / MF5171) TaxID=1116229 RepID=S3CWN7_GLAL2|nr:uncharacterized protein GLAREA_12798 [Glarea lozoyensis ATCC 20868]EPE30075.1 hypothetical protein GLAREA_12798 [Glarea lozoyensis ATCC 20868]